MKTGVTGATGQLGQIVIEKLNVITSYSIHYTKLYEYLGARSDVAAPHRHPDQFHRLQ